MAAIGDQEIYRRTVNELPFTEDEEEARLRYWRQRSTQERLHAGHELLRRHYKKLGIDVDTLRMDKTVVRFARLGERDDLPA
jgi:hypothetical protein